jgi:GTP pyrophosphokinase
MKTQNVSFDEVYDKFAPNRLQINPHEEKFLSLKIYSIVTDHYRPSPSRLRDWISSPKSTGYEALHITVMGQRDDGLKSKSGVNVWMKLRRKVAAHYKYKKNETLEAAQTIELNTKEKYPREFRNLAAVEAGNKNRTKTPTTYLWYSCRIKTTQPD